MTTDNPTFVMVHGRGRGDCHEISKIIEVGSSYRVLSYTDTDQWNPHNNGMFEEILGSADYLLVDDQLLDPPTVTARIAIAGALGCGARIGFFDDDNRPSMIDQVSAQRIITTPVNQYGTESHDALTEDKGE